MANDPTQIEIAIPEGLTKDERLALADDIIEFIVSRTQSGKDKNNRTFPGYSAEYMASLDFKIGKKGKKVDLQLSGDMLAALSLIRDRKDALVIGFKASDAGEKDRAEGNILGTYGQPSPIPGKKRDFLGITKKDLNLLLANYGD